MKKGVIVASFGTSHEDTRKKTIDVIENDIRENFTDSLFFRAWTSNIIRAKLKKTSNLHINNIEEAIEEAIKEGVEDLLVISTHIINGVEHNKVKDTVLSYKNSFKKIRIGNALLESEEDFSYMIKEMDAIYKREENNAYLLMGHGSEHEANKIYEMLRERFVSYGRDDIHIACVEGYPYIEDVLPELADYKAVHLYPFMIVAGDHAKNDMAGDDESFKTMLEDMGKQVDFELKGLGEYDYVRKLILKHAKEAYYV
nr:sirohydrochlorin cobaltochelatase [uncultured Lachnoanaerobaculum sp.]